MKNRLTDLFEKRQQNILSVFYTAGFPTLSDTVRIAMCLEEAGADIIEIGIPFSDPVADGPIIQGSNKVALENGMTVPMLLEQVREIRKTVSIPLVLMGYLNPVYQYGIEKFIKEASAAGVDGLILPDLPLAEYETMFAALLEQEKLSMSFLMTPTTSHDRIEKIDHLSSGFVYAVSASSTTGTQQGFSKEQEAYFQKVKDLPLRNPRLIGFGISNQKTFSTACRYAAGAIIGSAFIKMLEQSSNLETDIQQFIKTIKA